MTDTPTPATPFCAAVDWGTSSFRLWLLDADGGVLGERRSREGMATAGGTGFGAVLESHLAILKAPENLPVVVCGMAGARQGWVEAPYVDAPADLAEIARGAIGVPGTARDVRILPGVAQRPGGDEARGADVMRGPGVMRGPDVMRGEETQVMGLGLDGDALLCLPGTHSKWVAFSQGRIAGFSTFMTGEVFALLCDQSILKHAVSARSEVLDERDAFAAGVGASLETPAAILNLLFSLRADGLFGNGRPETAHARLSGLVLGLEMAGAMALSPERRDVVLVASGPLQALYREALGLAGFAVAEADADAAVRKGLLAAARHCFGHGDGKLP